MKVYVAMIHDRHCDPEPYVFSTANAAVDFARDQAADGARSPEDVEESTIDGWLYYATYSPEGDSVWVIEKDVEMDERADGIAEMIADWFGRSVNEPDRELAAQIVARLS